MILQRDQQARIWGQAQAKQDVTISLLGKNYSTRTDTNGDWELLLPANPKAGPFDITITADTQIIIRDVYYGDIWIAGGQSNMEWPLKEGVIGNQAEIAKADFPQIRFFKVPKTFAPTRQDTLPDAQWQTTSPTTVGNFSAVAWYFAKNLHLSEDIAVGIIESNWGGTPAQAWTDISVLKNVEGYQSVATKIEATDNWPQIIEDNEKVSKDKWERIGNVEIAKQTQAHLPEYDDADWPSISLPNSGPMHDFIWLRRTFELSSIPEQGITINLGDTVQNAFIFVNGHLIGTENWQNNTSIYDVSPDILQPSKNTIAVRLNNDWDNKAYMGKQDNMWIEVAGQKTDISTNWKINNSIEAPMPIEQRFSNTSSFLYNAMIHPLLPFTAKGVIWYQGESNVGEYKYYKDLFSAMISNWRERAQNPNMPFLFVQLAAFLPHQALQPESAWAFLRDAQKQTLALDNTAMAVSIDIGDAEDIHPRNKQDVGTRLWRHAADMVYGRDIVPSGPLFSTMTKKDNHLVLSFKYSNNLSTTDKQSPSGFIIAGQDAEFKVANAEIVDDKLVLSHPQITDPVEVRYAWADNPKVNLINSEQLPAVPFKASLQK